MGYFIQQYYAIKNIGNRARSRPKDRRTSLPGPSIENNTVFPECTRLFARFAVQELRNHFNLGRYGSVW